MKQYRTDWTREQVSEAEVYCTQCYVDDPVGASVDHCCFPVENMIKNNDDTDPAQAGSTQSKLPPEGITFAVPKDRKLEPALTSMIRRLHVNLCHPSNKELQRFCKLGGATKEVQDAVGWIRCSSCAHCNKPRAHRPARLPPADLQFGDEVLLDCFYNVDVAGQGHWCLSVMDRFSSYHVAVMIDDHSSECLYAASEKS
jgi:hypothetical protein